MDQKKTALERAVELLTKRSIDEIRATPLDEFRKSVELKHRRPLRFVSRYPRVGRGNVLRGRNLSAEEIESMLDEALCDVEEAV